MSDAADLPMIAGTALPAAFTFLFQRLNAALERRRSGRVAEPEPAPAVPAELQGSLRLPLHIDAERLDERLPVLEALALAMAPYSRDLQLITRDDVILLQTLSRVREALEDVYGQRFTFEGEPRDPSGPLTEHHYDSVAGDVTGMEATQAIRGSVTSRIKARSVEPGGRITGMKAPVIEDRN